MDQGIATLTRLGSTVSGNRGRAPKQFYDARILETLGKREGTDFVSCVCARVRDAYESFLLLTFPIMGQEHDRDFIFRFQFFVRRPCPKRIFFASSVIPGGAGLIVFANAYARWTGSRC
jgi:hypothetical protein